jgi:hypothetical protein
MVTFEVCWLNVSNFFSTFFGSYPKTYDVTSAKLSALNNQCNVQVTFRLPIFAFILDHASEFLP